jgi:hypothetical protein
VFVGAAPGRICSYPGALPGPSVRFAAADGARREQRLSGHGCLFPEKSAESYAGPDRPGMSGRNNRSAAPFIMVWGLRLSPLSDRRAIGPVFSDWHGGDAHGVRPIRLWFQPDRDWRFMRGAGCQRAGFPRRVAGFGETGSGAPRSVCPGSLCAGTLSIRLEVPSVARRCVFARSRGMRGFRVAKLDIRPSGLVQVPEARFPGAGRTTACA